jgi:hypothetical protein
VAPAVPPAIVNVVDPTPPTMIMPARVVANATSPAGARVRYAVLATDSAGAQVTAICSRASAATFPIGTTTVSCSATDARGHVAPSRTFTVHVKGAAEQLADALRQATSWKARSHALPDRVRQVARAFAKGSSQPASACRLLANLRQDLRGALGKGLTTAQRSTLRTELARVANVTGCAR